MAAAMGDEMSDEVAAGQGQVADQIERLVADAFVFHSQLVVERAFGAENEQVLVRHPLAQPPLAQPLGLFSEDECPRGSNLGPKGGRRELELDRLPANRIVRSII